MMSPTLISFASGLVSALLFMSGTTGTGLGAVLMTLSPLPLFIAGLGFGLRGGLMSTGIGVVLTGITLAGAAPLFYFAFAAAPALVLSYLALLVRFYDNNGPAVQGAPRAEWFPVGGLILAAAGIASIAVAIVLSVAFGTAEQYEQTMRGALEPLFETLASQVTQGMPADDVAQLKARFLEQAVRVVPAVFGVSAMVVTLANLWLGGYIARRSGFLARPWIPLERLDYPKLTAAALLVAFLAGRGEGVVALVGTAFTGTLVFAYFLLGAVSMITLTAGTVFRPFAVIAVILSVILEPFAIFIAIFGLLESFMQLRAKKAAGASGPAGTT